jgi:hypothetical protein
VLSDHVLLRREPTEKVTIPETTGVIINQTAGGSHHRNCTSPLSVGSSRRNGRNKTNQIGILICSLKLGSERNSESIRGNNASFAAKYKTTGATGVANPIINVTKTCPRFSTSAKIGTSPHGAVKIKSKKKEAKTNIPLS